MTRNECDIYMKNGYVFKAVEVTEMGYGGDNKYIKFYQIVDGTRIPAVIFKEAIKKIVKRGGEKNV